MRRRRPAPVDAERFTGVRRPRWVGMVSLGVGAPGALWAASHGWGFAAFFGLVGAFAGWARWRGSGSLGLAGLTHR